MSRAYRYRDIEIYSRAHSPNFPSFHLRQNSPSPTLPSLNLRHSSFSNPSVASPTSQLILKPFFRFSYVTGSSLTSLGEPPGELSEELVTQEKRKKGWIMNCDVGEVTERLEKELCYDYNYELCSFSNISVTSPTAQLILQPFFRFSYVSGSSPGEPPML